MGVIPNYLAAGNGNMILYDISRHSPILRYIPTGTLYRMNSGTIAYKEQVDAIAFSPDGKNLVTAAPDGIYMWEIPLNGTNGH